MSRARVRLTLGLAALGVLALGACEDAGGPLAITGFSEAQVRRVLRMAPLPEVPAEPTNAVAAVKPTQRAVPFVSLDLNPDLDDDHDARSISDDFEEVSASEDDDSD